MDHPKYSAFNISETTYKTVNNQPINTFVLIPKNIAPGPHPIIVKWHGGFLVTGHALYTDWFGDWALEWALSHSAIIIAPLHRLIPESTGLDVLSDVSDFYTWLSTQFPAYLKSINDSVTADLEHTVVNGDSAGGYLAVMSGLNSAKYSQNGLKIKAVLAAYPMIDLRSDYLSKALKQDIMGSGQMPPELLSSHIAAMEPGKIITSTFPPERLPLALCMVQQGAYRKYFGEASELYTFDVLEKAKREEVPYMGLYHGKEDSAVPVEGSERFVREAERVLGKGRVDLCVREGEEHAFDALPSQPKVSIEDEWFKEVLAKVDAAWLS